MSIVISGERNDADMRNGNRIFVLSGRRCIGDLGGSAGVNYKLFLANKKYNLYAGMIHIFLDLTLSPKSKIPKIFAPVKTAFRKRFVRLLGVAGIIRDIAFSMQTVLRADSRNKFRCDDIFIAQDIEIAFAIALLKRKNKMYFIYHNQGSPFFSHSALRNGKTLRMFAKPAYELITRFVIKRSERVAFPSQGAAEAFLETSSSAIRKRLSEDYDVIYNGLNIPSPETVSQCVKSFSELGSIPDLFNIREHFKSQNGNSLIFVTVARLDEAKNIQTVPAFLANLKKRLSNEHLCWILIGDGACSEYVEKAIRSSQIEAETLWIRETVPHDMIFNIFRQCDFYIIMQKISVFDYATLEAMGCGCIPVLSNIGGNKEMNVQNNCILVNDTKDIDECAKVINEGDIQGMKELNRNIQSIHFGDSAFLKRYLNWVG